VTCIVLRLLRNRASAVCMYVRMCLYIYIYIYIYICCPNMWTYDLHVCMHECMYVWMQLCMYANVCAYVCMYVCMYVCIRLATAQTDSTKCLTCLCGSYTLLRSSSKSTRQNVSPASADHTHYCALRLNRLDKMSHLLLRIIHIIALFV
jgi:hypothetical protein